MIFEDLIGWHHDARSSFHWRDMVKHRVTLAIRKYWTLSVTVRDKGREETTDIPMAVLANHMRLAGWKVAPPLPGDTAAVERVAAENQGEPLERQIDRLANFIMEHVPGEPSRNEGAVDTAIRCLAKAHQRIADLEDARLRLMRRDADRLRPKESGLGVHTAFAKVKFPVTLTLYARPVHYRDKLCAFELLRGHFTVYEDRVHADLIAEHAVAVAVDGRANSYELVDAAGQLLDSGPVTEASWGGPGLKLDSVDLVAGQEVRVTGFSFVLPERLV